MASILDAYLYASNPHISVPMKAMVYLALLALMSTAGCSSQKHLEKSPPFKVSDPSVQVIAAGREPGGISTELRFRFSAEDPGQVQLDSLYFRGRTLIPVLTETETGMVVWAKYPSANLAKPDLTMHADSAQEAGNQPPAPLPVERAMPFKLERNQAVLSYRLGTDAPTRYYRIDNIVEKSARALPGRPH